MSFDDILYETTDGVATITINRPDKLNAFSGHTIEEMIEALQDAGWDKSIGVIVITGAGDRAFSSGGDQSIENKDTEGYGSRRGTTGIPIEEFQGLIREVPKPVIAKVRGYAIGGGNVIATVCDLTIAGESAIFGQVGPSMGSVDPGFGTAYLARVVGEKKAREIWYMCRQYTAREALEMGLANAVVPDKDLDEEVARWCADLMDKSPTALSIAKRSFNADTDHIKGIGAMGFEALKLYYATEESKEGGRAFQERRKPEFRKYVK
ncbi:MAG: 1,4-dihydroxy-2-naphthoyl-CoA synthase [Rhodospirillaceae bacterium]|jgi:2-ketocyclohexanecarboxyl-CoA hydrolase|nr:1,4-dihydroxy-2-naphthoyl-CoA synthase [Rhodospirillaceae bacterium]MBT4772431.1 1,4-dihydroxy-2-naphthoyl-CoA synthase [Rhodospirillaceae bacterium]MBT5358975.1 1,4-dihydroxy-2-naphthoyl-CoA synthase [Rhodospirillaceae bacterium]MBT5769661.1 1,4-dihydroxy-2-naphthoyl-CoA synthase [Rhodospirillaceae bacterium]MBT6309338.1 1,4-dihydroxy-2-naphthoyl-CoA synthase [Rhodospirillaceae bacterium]